MDVDSSLSILGIALSLLLLACTSAADAALTAIGRHRLSLLQAEDTPRAAAIQRLLSEPHRFKAAIICANLLATITATALTLHLTLALPPIWQIAALALLLLVVLIFGEALPKAIALRNPAGTAQVLARPISWLALLLLPLIALAELLARPFIRLLSGQPAPATPLVTEEELRMLVNVGEEEGLIEADERDMIEGVISFGDTLVREVMVPRVDIVALEATASLDEAIDAIVKNGHSRIPVFEETIDQVVGILYAKDILPLLRADERGEPITGLLRAPYFVPELMKVDALLRDLQTRKVHLAVVVDEYGGTAGLVTIEDLLEEIVGEIQDEYDAEEPSVQFVADGELIADSRVLLDDLNDITGLHLSSEESDRLGGLVYERLERVPREGDEVSLPDGVTITVLSVEGLGPRRLRVRYQAPSVDEPATTREEAVSERPT